MRSHAFRFKGNPRDVPVGKSVLVLLHQTHEENMDVTTFSVSCRPDTKEGLERIRDSVRSISGYCRIGRMEVLE